MPTQGDLYAAPFTDELLYMEQMDKVQFWQQKTFYSLDLSSMGEAAQQEYFPQPIKVYKNVFLYRYIPFCNVIQSLSVTRLVCGAHSTCA